MRQLPLGLKLRDHASFASFEAAGAAQAVQHLQRFAAGEPGVIWLYGGAAVGKSHLLQAVCAAVSPEARTGYFPLLDLQLAATDGTPSRTLDPRVLDGWQNLDVVCVDDVHVAAGDAALERALFSLYREIDERRARLVLAANAPPATLLWALRDIGSRFAAGSVYRLLELDEAAQTRVLTKRAQLRGFELPPDTTRYLQRRFPRDMRSLCALLDTLDDASLTEQRRLTVPFIRQVLGDSA